MTFSRSLMALAAISALSGAGFDYNDTHRRAASDDRAAAKPKKSKPYKGSKAAKRASRKKSK